jgi:flagellar biosynthetic protein FlhB
MAGEDQDSKTEQPTGKRLTEARDQGDIIMSQEVKTAASLAAITILVWWVLPRVMEKAQSYLTILISEPNAIRVTTETELVDVLGGLAARMALLMAIPFSVMLGLGLAVNYAQTGWLITFSKLAPNFSKLNPLNGLKRIFSMHGLVDFGKNLAKLTAVAVLFYFVMRDKVQALPLLPTMELPAILSFLHKVLIRLLLTVLGFQILIAAGDYFWQRFSYMKKLRMTRQEVKDEHKQSEGDPMIKARIRNLRVQRARQRMMSAVPKADVVVTNPTHFACALKYDPDTMNAPVLVAKGQDLLAFRIRELAKEHDVMIVENPPLARALYAAVEVDREVPPEHYKAVAEVISYVFRLKGKIRR